MPLLYLNLKRFHSVIHSGLQLLYCADFQRNQIAIHILEMVLNFGVGLKYQQFVIYPDILLRSHRPSRNYLVWHK
jgi:hypothetical protein